MQSCQKELVKENLQSAKIEQLNKFDQGVNQSILDIKEFAKDPERREKSIENEEKAQELLAPIVDVSIDLANVYGISEQELKDIFGDLDNHKIALFGLALYSLEDDVNEDNSTKVSSLNLFATNLFAAQKPNTTVNIYINKPKGPDVTDCALRAFGIYEITSLVEGRLTKTAILKLAGKVAGKYAGAIGAAWMVADFANCMDWV